MAELPPAWAAFIDGLAEAGGHVARENDLPVGAMLACASVESAWGTGTIYRESGNPFSLQKWPHTPFPRSEKTYWSRTKIAEGPPPRYARAPFACAKDPADAVRQWCEWILHYGDADGPPGQQDPKARPAANAKVIARRDALLAYRTNSIEFCMRLPNVGFGENATPALAEKSGKGYRDRLIKYGLSSYD